MEEFETVTSVGEAIRVGDRTIYPMIQVSTLDGAARGYFVASMSLLAIVVVEPTRKYAFSLTGETVALDQFLEKIPALKKKLK
jgi:hypothetical protein